jgi:transcriptional regulator with XRE-family HTH domain
MAKKFRFGYDGFMTNRDNHPQRWKDFSHLVALELVFLGKRKGIRQKQIAEAIDVSEAQMSLYVKGKRGIMTVGHLIAACDLLDVDPRIVVAAAYAKLGEADGGTATVTQLHPVAPVSDPDASLVPIAAQTNSPQAEFEEGEQ